VGAESLVREWSLQCGWVWLLWCVERVCVCSGGPVCIAIANCVLLPATDAAAAAAAALRSCGVAHTTPLCCDDGTCCSQHHYSTGRVGCFAAHTLTQQRRLAHTTHAGTHTHRRAKPVPVGGCRSSCSTRDSWLLTQAVHAVGA